MPSVFRFGNFSFGTSFKLSKTVRVVVFVDKLKIAIFDETDVFVVGKYNHNQGVYPLYSEFLYDKALLVGNGHIYNAEVDGTHRQLISSYFSNSLYNSQLIFDDHVKLGKYLIVFEDYFYEIVLFNPEKIPSVYPIRTEKDIAAHVLNDALEKSFNSVMVFDAMSNSNH